MIVRALATTWREKGGWRGGEVISDPEVFQALEIRLAIVEPCCSWALRRKIHLFYCGVVLVGKVQQSGEWISNALSDQSQVS